MLVFSANLINIIAERIFVSVAIEQANWIRNDDDRHSWSQSSAWAQSSRALTPHQLPKVLFEGVVLGAKWLRVHPFELAE